MDCDGLKKNLLLDLDGTLVGQVSSIFSQADYDWGSYNIFIKNCY
jgi:hypothetical protein